MSLRFIFFGILLTFIVCQSVGCKVSKYLIRRRILPDPVFVLNDLPIPETNFLIRRFGLNIINAFF